MPSGSETSSLVGDFPEATTSASAATATSSAAAHAPPQPKKKEVIEKLTQEKTQTGQGFKAKMTILNPGFVKQHMDEYYAQNEEAERQERE